MCFYNMRSLLNVIHICCWKSKMKILKSFYSRTVYAFRSPFNYIIASLCVSDFISALISPLFFYKMFWGFWSWKASSFLCKVSTHKDPTLCRGWILQRRSACFNFTISSNQPENWSFQSFIFQRKNHVFSAWNDRSEDPDRKVWNDA